MSRNHIVIDQEPFAYGNLASIYAINTKFLLVVAEKFASIKNPPIFSYASYRFNVLCVKSHKTLRTTFVFNRPQFLYVGWDVHDSVG